LEFRKNYSSSLINCNYVKIFADGIIESKTAALLEPYQGTTCCGEPNLDPKTLFTVLQLIDQHNFNIHIHAIGDYAIHMSLNTLEDIQKIPNHNNRNLITSSRRHQITHCELLSPSDIIRFNQLKILANIQPYWGLYDEYISKLTAPLIGSDRMKNLYRFRALHNAGAMLVGGSDSPVSDMSPFHAIQVGITRYPSKIAEQAKAPHPLLIEESLDLPTLLHAYTTNGAYAVGQENQTGSIEANKYADFIILNQNLFQIPVTDISKTLVEATYLNGKLVYERETNI